VTLVVQRTVSSTIAEYENQLMKDMNVKLVDDIIKHFTRMTLDDFEYLVSLIEAMLREAMFFDCGNFLFGVPQNCKISINFSLKFS